MGRRAKRRPIRERAPRWRAARNGVGRWIVVNEHGEDIHRIADPVAQMEAAYLAAAAPTLREALEELARRLLYLELPYSRDARRAEWAWSEIAGSRPPAEARLEAEATRAQLELDLQHEVA